VEAEPQLATLPKMVVRVAVAVEVVVWAAARLGKEQREE
tara:strand:+ start:587 stop:703 length:117 start_codon:yes stop_codon:yes gene_type:complete